jgi:hypothetical protein
MPYIPHSSSLLRDPCLLRLLEVSNLMVSLACFLIPLCLTALLVALSTSENLRAKLRHRLYVILSSPGNFLIAVQKIQWLLGLFAAFIFLCGWTHIFDLITLYAPVYWQRALLLFLTGLVSLTTAVTLLILVVRVVINGRHRQS